MRAWRAFGAALLALAIAGCGGGGGGGSGGSSGSSGSSGNSSNLSSNQVAINVGVGVGHVVNIPTVSVTVCGNNGTCQTIDNIQVDTMSYGLRIAASAASTVLGSLPTVTDGSGNMVAECTVFADGYTWGSVRRAAVTIGGKMAASVPVAIIGDMDASTVPTLCSNTGVAENTVSALGANGILGIGVAPYDCGSGCVTSAASSPYFACPGGVSCTQSTIALADQVANPVVKFSSDNNGVILTMPAIGASGSSSVSGTMTFGIGTQSNNALSAAQTFGTDAGGNVDGTYSGTASTTFFDSGSNGYFLEDSTLTTCTGQYASFYCPAASTTRSVAVVNASGASASGTVAMPIGNAISLFTSGNYAFNNLAGHIGLTGYVDVGMPFFYGRTVYFGYDMTQVGGTQNPYVAF